MWLASLLPGTPSQAWGQALPEGCPVTGASTVPVPAPRATPQRAEATAPTYSLCPVPASPGNPTTGPPAYPWPRQVGKGPWGSGLQWAGQREPPGAVCPTLSPSCFSSWGQLYVRSNRPAVHRWWMLWGAIGCHCCQPWGFGLSRWPQLPRGLSWQPPSVVRSPGGPQWTPGRPTWQDTGSPLSREGLMPHAGAWGPWTL